MNSNQLFTHTKAGLNWHQVCTIDKQGNTIGMVQLLPGAILTDFLTGFQLVHASCPRVDKVTGVIGQSEFAGCYHSLDLMLRLGLAGGSRQMLVEV